MYNIYLYYIYILWI